MHREGCESACRIVLTGGPGGGKTTAADLLRRELGERVVVVPESATLLFSGGFPRAQAGAALRGVQSAIFHVQRNLEDVQAMTYPDRVLLCDRGTVDGAAYWPDGDDAFFQMLGTTLQNELARYDAVIFFETAAAGGISIEGGNPIRTEGLAAARALDERLQALWQQHPRFTFVANQPSFIAKIMEGLRAIQDVIHSG